MLGCWVRRYDEDLVDELAKLPREVLGAAIRHRVRARPDTLSSYALPPVPTTSVRHLLHQAWLACTRKALRKSEF